jgi:hypothetical protein
MAREMPTVFATPAHIDRKHDQPRSAYGAVVLHCDHVLDVGCRAPAVFAGKRRADLRSGTGGARRSHRRPGARTVASGSGAAGATPVACIVANAIAPCALALVHPSRFGGEAPDLEQAQLAIDALGALVEGLGPLRSRHEEPLRDALGELLVAFVETSRRAEGRADDRSG